MIVPDGADPGGRPAAATCPEIVGTINAATTAIHTRPDLKPRRDIVCFQRAAQVDREKRQFDCCAGHTSRDASKRSSTGHLTFTFRESDGTAFAGIWCRALNPGALIQPLTAICLAQR
jgi:hypothetical protein